MFSRLETVGDFPGWRPPPRDVRPCGTGSGTRKGRWMGDPIRPEAPKQTYRSFCCSDSSPGRSKNITEARQLPMKWTKIRRRCLRRQRNQAGSCLHHKFKHTREGPRCDVLGEVKATTELKDKRPGQRNGQ